MIERTIIGSLPSCVHWYNVAVLRAGVAELVDAPDSKSGDRKIVWVRVPPPAQHRFPANRHFSPRMTESPWSGVQGLWQQYGSSRLGKGFFHRRRSLVSHVRQHVGIRVEGNDYGRMPKHFGDYLRVHIAGE